MVTVAPSGATNEEVRFDTLPRFLRVLRVVGKVSEEDEVENAVINAGLIALTHAIGEIFPTTFSNSGKTTPA